MNIQVSGSQCQIPLESLVPEIKCYSCQAITDIPNPRNVAHHFYQNAHPHPPPSASPHGSKKAVICGISYRNSRHELRGCINDAKCMRSLLINRFHFPESSIIMLTDEEIYPYKIPTKHNLLGALDWLVQGCRRGDSLVFHYSGHGSRLRKLSGEQVDGYHETLCPLDFEIQGMIVDDEINETIVRPLPFGVKLHAIIDARHSGTVLNLPFLCSKTRGWQYDWMDYRPRSGVQRGTSGGEAISFSGCDDDQTSADSSALSRITSTGAMTFCFIQAIERGQINTYANLLHSMRSAIHIPGVGEGRMTPLITMLLKGGSIDGRLRQEPMLTASKQFDIYSRRFNM